MRRLLLLLCLLVGAALVGSLPISGEGKMLEVPSDAPGRLTALKSEPKFEPDQSGLYTGVRDPALRREAEAIINGVIERVESLLARNPTKDAILREFEVGLSRLKLFDTEDRERAAGYLERVLDCVGMESSDGVLNRWLYGVDPK